MNISFTPTLAEFRELATRGNLVPVHTELIADAESPVSAFQKIDDGGYSFLFESVEKSDQVGRYSFVGAQPRIIFESRGRDIRITENGAVRAFETARDPLHELQSLMERYRLVPSPAVAESRFVGGAVGYLGYDMVRFFEPTVTPSPPDDLDLPESLFVITETQLIFDHRTRRLRVVANAFVEGDADMAYARAVEQIQSIVARLAQPTSLPALPITPAPQFTDPTGNTTPEDYMKMVGDGKEFIRAGDIFQFVPSQRFGTDYTGDELTLYRALRFVNPSPYMFVLKFAGRFSLVGSSPEVHVRAIDGKIEIRPIAGTRRRGATLAEDEANAADLLADPKERAEHLMLVDLARNDVGRASEFGSVKVTDFMTIEKYSHVMHIVSNVEGRLRPDRNAYDVMRATFPAGTVSGSPKVRALQIINGCEKNKRGVYAGAVGYFGFDGNCDSCIALRTIVLKDGKAYVQAGAGIVADSAPESEHQECVNKAMGMMAAIARAKQFSNPKN
ncbi:MAG TPA: anthranilate synthase component I [Chthoniobacteraceae bacterium]|jgi:anthranilate synthase component 1|nr:anthranilate synthase component I [Chthoniobacteraceae bacterium]